MLALTRIVQSSTRTFIRKVSTSPNSSSSDFKLGSAPSLWFSAAAGLAATSLYLFQHTEAAEAAQSQALDAQNPQFHDFPVSEIKKVNHNTKIIRLALEKDQQLGLKTASCIVVKLDGVNGKDGKPVIRPYTPLDSDTTGYFDLLVKRYETGALTPHLHNLKPGDKVSVKGPISKLPYQPNSKKSIGMIAGGSGLTPCLQVAHEILRNPNDKTDVTFVFANIAEEDILLKKELDDLAAKHKNFKVHYVLEKPPAQWDGSVGYVSKEVIQKFMPTPSNDHLVLVCGPPPMMKAISGSKAPDYTQGEVAGLLKDLGYTSEQVFKF